jgi:hypothetical protein
MKSGGPLLHMIKQSLALINTSPHLESGCSHFQGMQLTNVSQRFYVSHFSRYLLTADANITIYSFLRIKISTKTLHVHSHIRLTFLYVTLETKSSFDS